jgi:hypothetical protein
MHFTKIDGKPVYDAKSKLVIEINRQDIIAGKSKDPSSCAAARACLRQVPKCTSVRVYKSRAFLKLGEKWFRYHTPATMRLEIVAFDRGAKFLPGVYTLTPLQPSHKARGVKMGGKAPKNNSERKPNPKKRAPYHVIEGVREFSTE